MYGYSIFTQTGHLYTCEGISHQDALRRFIANPAVVYGFHEGNYETDPGEKFIVVGRTQEDSKPVSVELIACESQSFHFKTQAALDHEERVMVDVVMKYERNHMRGVLAELKVTENLRTPPYDLVSDDFDFRPYGVRLNGVTVPWAYILDVDYAVRDELRA